MKYIEEIKHLLETEHSKSQTNKLIEFVGTNKVKMKTLMHFFMDNKWHWRFNQRAAWPVGFIGRQNPNLIEPYLPTMVDMMDNPSHNAVLRNIVRIFEEIDLPEELEGAIYDKCFNILNDPNFPIAVRCFSMTVLHNIAVKHPGLKEELSTAIRLHLPFGSAGFQNRGKRLLKKMQI